MSRGAFDLNPSLLRSLQYFEAVARLGSVKSAAGALGVTASAISHQLKSLAAHMGEELFIRSGRGLALTERGQQLQAQIASAMSDLALAVRDGVGEKRARLRIAVCSSFGPFWLAQRLPEFLDRNPGIDVELRLYAQFPEQTDTIADAFVTGNPVAQGFDSVPLFDEFMVAVGKAREKVKPTSKGHRLITTEEPPTQIGQDWLDFWTHTGQDPASFGEPRFLYCTHYLLALALAKAGLGDALVPSFVAAEALANGELTQVHPAMVPSGRTYRLCFKMSRSKDPDLRMLARWLKGDGASPK